MSKLYGEDGNRELIGNALVFCSGICVGALLLLTAFMPGSALHDQVMFIGAPWEAWKVGLVIGVMVFALGIGLWKWDR